VLDYWIDGLMENPILQQTIYPTIHCSKILISTDWRIYVAHCIGAHADGCGGNNFFAAPAAIGPDLVDRDRRSARRARYRLLAAKSRA
jgi:hypothetical protein